LAALLSLLAAELAPLLPAASRKGVLILVLLGLGHGVCAFPAPAVDGAALEEEGNDKYAAGDYAGAVSAFRAALATSPQSSRIAYNLGNALYRAGDFKAAAASYEAALSGAPLKLRAKTLFNLGNAAYRLRRLEEAARRYDEALRLDPEDRDARANLAFTAQRLMGKRAAAAAAAGMPTAAAPEARPASGSPGGGASGGRASGSGGSRSPGAPPGAPTGAAAVVHGREGPAPRSEPAGSDPGDGRRWALGVLERVQDRAGSARLPAYGRRVVERDW
jgi:Ca-activated chloride channel family protein